MRGRDVYIKITRKSYSIRGVRDIEWDCRKKKKKTPYKLYSAYTECKNWFVQIGFCNIQRETIRSSSICLKDTHFRGVQGRTYNCNYSRRGFLSITVTIFIATWLWLFTSPSREWAFVKHSPPVNLTLMVSLIEFPNNQLASHSSMIRTAGKLLNVYI